MPLLDPFSGAIIFLAAALSADPDRTSNYEMRDSTALEEVEPSSQVSTTVVPADSAVH